MSVVLYSWSRIASCSSSSNVLTDSTKIIDFFALSGATSEVLYYYGFPALDSNMNSGTTTEIDSTL